MAMPSEYESIKRELGLRDTRVRRLFEKYCEDCRDCTTKLEWSCKVSSDGVRHRDRFVQVTGVDDRPTWFRAGRELLGKLLPRGAERDLAETLDKLSIHSRQLFAGYSGAVSESPGAERLKLYFALSGESDGLWGEIKNRIGRSSLAVEAPAVSAWLFVFVLSENRPPVFRADLVYDSIEFRDPEFMRRLGSILRRDELDFISSEARGIVSLREAEREMLYSYVEFASRRSPRRALAERLAGQLPAFQKRIDGLTWVGVPRGSMDALDDKSVTLYAKIWGPGGGLVK